MKNLQVCSATQPEQPSFVVDDLELDIGVTLLERLVERVLDSHKPRLGLFIPLLGILTAAFIGAFSSANLGWPWATVLAAVVAIVVVASLLGARLSGFVWRHPTLAELQTVMAKIDNAYSSGVESEAEIKELLDRLAELTTAVANEYLTDEQWDRVSHAFDRSLAERADRQ